MPEIGIWRVATLMLKHYGDEAMMESAKRAESLAADGDARRRCNLAPDYRRDRTTYEHNAFGAGALIGTSLRRRSVKPRRRSHSGRLRR
jgi:hypothetical protein